MEVYFANKQCNKYCRVNLPMTVKGEQKQNNRPHSAMKAAEIDLKDQIKVSFKPLVIPRIKTNPELFKADIGTLLTNSQPLKLDYLDDMLAKNKKKRLDYGALSEIANLSNHQPMQGNGVRKSPAIFPPVPTSSSSKDLTSPVSPPLRANVPFDFSKHSSWNNHVQNQPQSHNRPNSLPSNAGYSIVDDLMNLTGMDRGKATRYLQKYGAVEKAMTVFNHEQESIQEFMRREKVSAHEAEFILQTTNYNIADASKLFKQMRPNK